MRNLHAQPYGRAKPNDKGQALAELGMVVVLSTLIFLGIVEFGYVLMALNTVTQATTAGARAASVVQMGSRSLCGKITDSSSIDGLTGLVRSQIGAMASIPPPPNGVVVIQNPTPNTATPCQTFSGSSIPLVTVTVTGTIPDVLGLFGSVISFTRSATFRDEARTGP
jgi:hypothetical protein